MAFRDSGTPLMRFPPLIRGGQRGARPGVFAATRTSAASKCPGITKGRLALSVRTDGQHPVLTRSLASFASLPAITR
jgi:hypothetical protein